MRPALADVTTPETVTPSGCPDAQLPLTGNERVLMDQGENTVDAPTSAIAALSEPLIDAKINLLTPEAIGALSQFVHTQATPSETWVINHSFNRYPTSVALFDLGGSVFFADVTHNSNLNQSVVGPMTGGPQAGYAILS